jgi:hypothetical protein
MNTQSQIDTVYNITAVFLHQGKIYATFMQYKKKHFRYFLGMHRILFLPDIRPAGYPANLKAGHRISGNDQITGRKLGLKAMLLVKYQINLS